MLGLKKTQENKKRQNKIKKFMLILDTAILNRDIYDFIIDKIDYSTNTQNIEITLTENSFSWKEKNNKESFFIEIGPSLTDIREVIIHYIGCEGRQKIVKSIEFVDENITRVTESEHNTVVGQNGIYYFEKNNHTKTYKNNKVAYDYQTEFRTDASIIDNSCSGYERTVYVFEDGSAVAREIRICEENACGSPTIQYLKTDNYDVPNYDTRIINKGVFVCGMSSSTQDEYERKRQVKEIVLVNHS